MSERTSKLSNQEWEDVIQNYRNSGLSVARWCKDHGVKEHQLRWQLNKRQKVSKDKPLVKWISFDSSLSDAAITVKIGQAEISVTDGFNKKLFAEVVHSLITLC